MRMKSGDTVLHAFSSGDVIERTINTGDIIKACDEHKVHDGGHKIRVQLLIFQTHSCFDGENVLRQSFIIERSVGEQNHFIRQFVDPVVETSRLSILFGYLSRLNDVVDERIGYRREGLESLDHRVDGCVLADPGRHQGVVFLPLGVGVRRLRDFDVHANETRLRRDSFVPRFDFNRHQLPL